MGGDLLASKTIIGAAWMVSWRLISRSLGLVSTLILARVLVPADFGIVAMATTFAAAVDALSQLGLQDALVRRVGDNSSILDTAFTLQVARAILISIIIAAVAPAAAWWFNEPRLTSVLFLLAASSLISGLDNVGVAEFRRAMRFDMQFRLLLAPRLFQIAVTISLALLLQSYWALLFGILVYQLAKTSMTYIIHPYRPRFSTLGWQELAAFSFWTWAASAASVVWDRVDPFVLGPAIGPTQLGLYLLAMELALLPVSEVVSPISDALFAGFASAQKKGKSSVHHAPQVAAALVIFVMPITVTISCGSGYVVAALLGPKWVQADTVVAILAWLCLFSPLSYVCNMVLVANGHVQRNFIGKVIASVAKLAVLIIAVKVTERVELIAAAMTICVAIESCAYTILLKGLGEVNLTPMVGPIVRSLFAGAFVMLILYRAGLAWQIVTMPALQAFMYCGLLGATVVSLYSIFSIVLWYLSGRPVGAEMRIVKLVEGYIRPLAYRLSQ